MQTSLLQTSIRESLSAPLGDAVAVPRPAAGSRPVLHYLDQTNLFITPLDDCRTWCRCHRLFDHLLQRRLSQGSPDLVRELHRRAGSWYEEQGLLPGSIRHALAAADFERAATLIEQTIEPPAMRSELTTARNWLAALRDPVLYQKPALCACHAWRSLLAGSPSRASFPASRPRGTSPRPQRDGYPPPEPSST